MRTVISYGSGSRPLRIIPPLLLLSVLFACSPGDPGHLEPQPRTGELVLDGYVENWALGDDYYVFVGTPEVSPSGVARFPDNYASSRISRDGSFTLHLSEPAAEPQPGGICPDDSSELSQSFHYLAVTGRPEPGGHFTDIAYLRPDLPGDALFFVTWLEGLDPCAGTDTDRGWHAFVRNDTDVEGTVLRRPLIDEIGFELSL